MQAVICSTYGPPEVLKLVDVPTPAPRAGEVRIRVRATAVTSSDCYVRGLDLDPRYRLLARLALELLAELAASGSLRPIIDRVYPLEGIVEAHRYVSGGHKRGNVIVTVG